MPVLFSQYDSGDERTTLALGTLMLRKSRAKKLVDASYNRFAWNDPTDLPEWFVDDEVPLKKKKEEEKRKDKVEWKTVRSEKIFY
jgi:hypothetical protein